MKIGIDGKHISNLQKGGFKTYSLNLVKNLLKIDNENEYFIYLDRKNNFDILPQQKNVKYKIIEAINPLKTGLREQFLLSKAAEKERLDIFHFPANTGSINFSIKYIITLHDVIEFLPEKLLGFKHKVKGIKQYLLNKYDKFVIPKVIKNSNHIITISQNSKKEIIDIFKINEEKISVIYQGLRNDFKSVNSFQLKTNPIECNNYILVLGSVDLRKNIISLIKAFSEIEDLNIQLVIVSSHRNISNYLHSECLNYGVQKRIKIIENVSDEALKNLLFNAKVFVFPSLYEGFGLPILEALSLGVPVICSNTSSIPEVGGNAVRYINPFNIQEIKNAINDVLINNELVSKMREEGKKQTKKFSWENCARETLKIYERVYKG